MTEQRNRFPGAKPFTAEDQEIFYGREKDVNDLFDLLSLKKTIVLYAESGIGKSSLVNAGLIPAYKLRTAGAGVKALAIKIRFGLPGVENETEGDTNVLLTKVIDELNLHRNCIKLDTLPFTNNKNNNSLWYYVKLFERNGIRLLLALDQFEEIFTYTPEQVNLLKEQLFSLFSGVPKDINDLISASVKQAEEGIFDEAALMRLDEELQFMYAPLNTQVLYIIREDKLGYFNSFTNYFPDILKDTFKLLPLQRSSATDAITLPASRPGNFKTAPFTFSQPGLDKLLTRLAEKNNTYDPFTIQLTCRYIENALIKDAGKSRVEDSDIPEVSIIVGDFIDKVWKALPPQLQKRVDSFKETIETKLIAQDVEKRISVHEGSWKDEQVVAVLIQEGLLKRDRRGGVDYIELSHDRLIKPLLDDYKFRKQQEKLLKQKKKNRLFRIATVFVMLIAITGLAFFLNLHEQKDEKTLQDQKLVADFAQKKFTKLNDSINSIQIFNDSALRSVERAREAAERKNFNEAKKYFELAISASRNADDSKTADILQLQSKLIPDATNYYKIDIFFDERTLPESEQTADSLISILNGYKGYIVKKKLLTISRINKNPTWNITGNEIRHEQNTKESRLADTLIARFSKSPYILHNNKVPTKLEVRSGFSSPNYISIFVHD
jgi:hypothetical protein